MRKNKGSYEIKPLTVLADYQKYFESRYHIHKKLFPNHENYYEGKYEMDVYDRYSLHIGLFVEKDGCSEAVGFARVTQVITDPFYLRPVARREVIDFIYNGTSTNNSPNRFTPDLSLLASCGHNIRFTNHYKELREDNNRICEMGRLILPKEISETFKAVINLINYVLTVAVYHQIDYSLFQSTVKHGSFYKSYYNARPFSPTSLERERSSTMMPLSVNLKTVTGRVEKIRNRMLDQFYQANQVTGPTFRNSELMER